MIIGKPKIKTSVKISKLGNIRNIILYHNDKELIIVRKMRILTNFNTKVGKAFVLKSVNISHCSKQLFI